MNDAAPAPTDKPVRSSVARNPWLAAVIIALGLAGWQWLERQHQEEGQQEVLRRLADADEAGRTALHHAEEQIAALQAKSGALEARLTEFQEQAGALQGLYQDLSRNRDEATLLEVEQALILAGQQLQLTGNIQAALLALQAADAKLARLDRPAFMPLRKALARDIERLRQQPLVDVPGLSLKIENVVLAADKLPLAMNERPVAAPVGGAVPAAPWWQRVGGDAWQEIKSLVRIQRFDREEPALLAPGQAFFLRENLKLRLLNARLALLAREQAVFRGEVKSAQDWLARHFDGQDKGVQAALAGLRQLAVTDLAIEIPNLAETQAALRAVRAGKGGK